MKRARLPGMGSLGVILGLFVACSGKVQSLGETAGVGGKGTRNLGGAAGAESTDIGGAAGAESTNIAGASAVASGGSDRGWVTQLVGGQGGNDVGSGGYRPTGGATTNPDGGFTYAIGGRGGAPPTGAAGTSYATGGSHMPAAGYRSHSDVGGPIDPSCKCANAAQVCNVAKQCVPRCTPEGLCAQWQSQHAIKSMYHDGTALYFAEARSTDVLGNLVEPANASLYTLPTPTATMPTLVATGLQEPLKILGRYNGSTFLLTVTGTTYAIYEITDAKVVTKLADASTPVANMQGKWLISEFLGTKAQVNIFDLEAGRTPTVYIGGGGAKTGMIVVGDQMVYRAGAGEACSTALSVTSPETTPTCGLTAFADSTSDLLAADSSRVFFGGGTHPYLRAYDTTGNPQLILYNASAEDRIGTTVLANGWLYSLVYPVLRYGTSLPYTVRYPTTVGHLPQIVLPSDWGTTLFAVGKSDIYWTYPQTDSFSSHHIFHAPLPAQPCDANLPCADTTQVCTNGLCIAP